MHSDNPAKSVSLSTVCGEDILLSYLSTLKSEDNTYYFDAHKRFAIVHEGYLVDGVSYFIIFMILAEKTTNLYSSYIYTFIQILTFHT